MYKTIKTMKWTIMYSSTILRNRTLGFEIYHFENFYSDLFQTDKRGILVQIYINIV